MVYQPVTTWRDDRFRLLHNDITDCPASVTVRLQYAQKRLRENKAAIAVP
ncbi:MAG TPA: hypothetical protein V6C98_08685 [Thermosynechococcaceae cyanobacterium]